VSGVKNTVKATETYSYIDTIVYDEHGQRVYIKYGNGVETRYRYDDKRRWLKDIETKNRQTDETFQKISYSFDKVGNVLGYSNDASVYATSQSYTYDSLYQLIGVEGTSNQYKAIKSFGSTPVNVAKYKQDFAFDGIGNMTRKASTTNISGARGNAYPNAELDYSLDYEYDPAYAHRLIHAGNRYYRYDANGNITAEKDGPFTEDDAFIFTYNYDPDTDVYGADYGFGLDAPKETEETHPENLFAYRRNYTWNEKNLLTKSSGRSYTVHYRYGEDGQRALKYTEEGRSETLYFNNFYTIHIPVQDKNNPQGLRVHKHIFVGNSRLVTAMTHTDNNGDNAEQREKRYYYHSDHLGSAQFVTDWRGRQYEHIEYTPYGELWIEEVAAGLDKLPFRFTGKEMDEETGLYYYGARYLDPKYSRWLSGDPALGDYVPAAGTDPSKLAGMGGVYNTVNLHLYHYSGNNPVKYMDPDGRHNDVAELAKLLPEMWAAATAEPSVVGEIVVGAISLYILYRYNSSNADYDSNTLNAPSTIDRTFPNIQEQNKNVGSLPTKKDNTKPNSSSDEDIGSDMLEKYIPAPKDIPGIPGAERVKEKTPVKNGGGLRKRWKDNDGNIYEWDSQHGELEKYDKHGKHLGSVDPNTGEQIKPPKKGRKVEP